MISSADLESREADSSQRDREPLPKRSPIGLMGTALAAALTAGGCGGAALQAGPTPDAIAPGAATVIYDCAGHGSVRPSGIVLTCGAHRVELGVEKLVWAGWGSREALAQGEEVIRSCIPSCALGHTLTIYHAVVSATGFELHGTTAGYTELWVTSVLAPPKYRVLTYALTRLGPTRRNL